MNDRHRLDPHESFEAARGSGDVVAPWAPMRQVLRAVRTVFDSAVRALAADCAVDGALDAARLDARQLACYDLAFAAAELLAAETAVGASSNRAGAGTGEPPHVPDAPDAAGAGRSPLDRALGLVFAADAVVSVLGRLEAIGSELDFDDTARREVANDAGWRALRASVVGGPALSRLGAALCAEVDAVGDVALEPAHALAQDAFRRFAAEVVAPLAASIHRDDRTVPEALLGPLREMGVFGLAIPERFGGSRPDARDDTLLMLLVTEALSEASLAAAGSLITRPEILARALLAGGTDGQQRDWLPRIARGDPLCAIAITEPDFGSDVASLALKATRTPDGWRLDGAKTWCTFAGKAGVLMVVARLAPPAGAGHRGLGVLLVEKPASDGHAFEVVQSGGGRLSGRAIATIGYRGMHSFDLSFDGWVVPAANLVGGEAGVGRGFHITMAGMTGGRIQTAARACGVMRAALRAAVRHAGGRVVFGAPLAERPLARATLVRMAARYAACRGLAHRVGRLLDAGGGRMESSLVKLLACRAAEAVTRDAQQLHGGLGYAEETPVSRWFVDARVLSIFEGAEETLALKVVARSLLEGALAASAPNPHRR